VAELAAMKILGIDAVGESTTPTVWCCMTIDAVHCHTLINSEHFRGCMNVWIQENWELTFDSPVASVPCLGVCVCVQREREREKDQLLTLKYCIFRLFTSCNGINFIIS
jgi:hypothetical protein